MSDLTIDEKKMLLIAMAKGLIKKEDIKRPDFDLGLYTLQMLPILVSYSPEEGTVDFMNHIMTLEEYQRLLEFYRNLGLNSQILLIEGPVY